MLIIRMVAAATVVVILYYQEWNDKLTIVKYEPAIIHICVFKKFLYPIRINN